jgi:polysaccharide export outer membrane protein
MFKGHSDKRMAKDTLPSYEEYKILANDELEVKMYTNDGVKLLDPPLSASVGGGAQNSGVELLLDKEGYAKVPILGQLQLSGYTVKEAQILLSRKLAAYYEQPYVLLKVTSKRVFVFSGGTASVLKLKNENTSLVEVLASVGGISSGKAHKIKLIRGPAGERKIYYFDLSTIKNLPQADIYVQSNDIIYIDPVYNLPASISNQIFPYLSLVTTTLLLLNFFKK